MPSSCPWTVLLLLLLASSSVLGQSGEHFEDADKSSEYTDQQFDLRHTIPGEPGLDYPILSAPPKTSFVCKGRHEGYYADVESRCQAFRICAHTARTPQGFGFLCPNGTLFSQKNFVCDWYRNVNCDESERYYDMNVDHSVGSTRQMMERVRHMMEYPMKTITKALQQAQAQAHPQQTHSQQQQQPQSQHHHQHQSLSKDLSSASGVLTHPEEPQIAVVRGEAIKSEPLNAAGLQDIAPSASADDDGEGIYVNSLGELSSDPGIQFDHTNAHIVAEYPREYHYQKQKNFAERVNAGLELQADTESTSSEALAPDYMKHIRSNKDEATQVDLVSNINNLLDEVSSDLDPAVSGYQSMAPTKIKQPFRFLSRGFAMHGDGSKGSSSSAYVYSKPKQTPGTVRFTPNEIPTEVLKSTEHKHKFDKTTSSSTPATTEETPALLIAPTLPTAEEAEGLEEAETTTATTEAASSSSSTTITVPLALLEPPLLAPAFAIESLGQAAALTANLPLSDDVAQVEESPEAAEKTSVHQEAAKLLLAGVQLTSHDKETQVFSTNELAESSSTSTTPAMVTSTETVTEISSTQERIRGYRRYAQNRGNSTLRRANVRPLPVVRSTTSTTTQRTTTPTRSYLERLAASRQRLSRLSLVTRSTAKAPTTTTTATTEVASSTTASSLSYVRGGAEQGPSKKLSARHIDRETKVDTGKASWESVHSSLQRFQVQRGNRIYTPATRATGSSSGSSTTTTSASAPSTSTTSSFTRPTAAAGSVNRGKNRYSNYKTQAPVTRTRGTTTARVYTTTPSRTTSSPALSTLSQQISALASGYSYAQPAGNSPQTQKHTQTPHTLAYATQTVSDIAPHSSQSITSSLSPASGFLSFDKLTRAIVDDSVLQNFKSVQSKAAAPAQPQSQSQQYRPLAKSNSVGSRGSSRNSISYNKPATAPAISSLTVPQRPPQLPQPALPTPPGIVIVRAEGQQIAPNSAGNIIASLATQAPAKATQGSSYVSLNDFFSSKFGQGNAASVATLQQQQQQSQVQRQPAQQQHQVQQQQQRQQQVQQQLQRQQQPQQQLNYITQQYQQPQQTIYQPNIYQQQQQQQAQFHQQQQQQQQNPFLQQHQQQQQFQQQSHPSIQSNQQPYLTPNIFVPYQQQQQQLPQFPPLAAPAPVSATGSVQGSFIGGRHVDHLNVQLPALTNGLIPGLQLAQKRSDVSAHQLQLTDRHPARSGSGKSRERSFYSGRTSYQVPQSSVGRLPNDITQQLRGRLRRY